MSALYYLCAFALLMSPPKILESPRAEERYAPLAPALRSVAMWLEVLDPRETYLLDNPFTFAADLRTLQQRFQELQGAPPVSDCKRFPDREMAGDLLALNRHYREGLCSRLEVDRIHAEELRAALRETDHLHRVWDRVCQTHCECYYVYVRRRALRELRELAGAHAYYTGQLPPHVPLWRLPVADR
jgi:hypothetical protein